MANGFKGKRGEALSMAMIAFAMALITDLETPQITDYVSLAVLLLSLGRIIWIFPSQNAP
ncbi:hypothetical protein HQ496_02970 [bacterium]|nr:hypothetical protein [bacterium]